MLMLQRRSEKFLPPDRAFKVPNWLGWIANAWVVTMCLVLTVFFCLPPFLPVTGSIMSKAPARDLIPQDEADPMCFRLQFCGARRCRPARRCELVPPRTTALSRPSYRIPGLRGRAPPITGRAIECISRVPAPSIDQGFFEEGRCSEVKPRKIECLLLGVMRDTGWLPISGLGFRDRVQYVIGNDARGILLLSTPLLYSNSGSSSPQTIHQPSQIVQVVAKGHFRIVNFEDRSDRFST